MAIFKTINNNELCLYLNGNLIYKRWLATGYSKVFDVMAYDKHTLLSIRDLEHPERTNETEITRIQNHYKENCIDLFNSSNKASCK